MKLYEIEAIKDYLKRFNFIKKARRVANNIIELNFSKDISIYFDLTRGNSTIYKSVPSKRVDFFNAPFDTKLNLLLSFSEIIDIEVPNDKIIIFKVKPQNKYKEKIIKARFELTGKYTNMILSDEKDIVIEALHHIDSSKSYREVKPGVKLKELLPFKTKFKGIVEDVEKLLEENFKKHYKLHLKRAKEQRLNIIEKKIKKLQDVLYSLEDENILKNKAKRYFDYANIILANLHKIKPYDKVLRTVDFKGEPIEIELPLNTSINRISEYFFKKSKRALQKANNIKIEKKNLKERLTFYKNIKEALINSNNLYEIELLVPKQARVKYKKGKNEAGEIFWIEGYKVYVGRNSNENIKVLKEAKANDIWMHIRDYTGSHVIIRTNKQNLPESVLNSAAKLAVDFSVSSPGVYEVDFTKRKFVKLNDGSNVEYDKYKTIIVRK